MIKVFFEEISGVRPAPLAYPFFKNSSAHFEHLPYRKIAQEQMDGDFVERVDSPQYADYILIPYIYKELLNKHENYIKKTVALSQETNKKIIIFAFQDSAKPIDIPEAIIFRMSSYVSDMNENEFIMPYVVEDLLKDKEIVCRSLPGRPTVGFVGWAGFDSLKQKIRSAVKELFLNIYSIIKHQKFLGIRRKGLYLRMEMINILKKSAEINTNFVIRKKFSGHTKNIQKKTVKETRDEYVCNILESDITLAPRGEGNGSMRFYEVLSLGRIPLLIDTGNKLPLEELVPYERFVITVPYKERKNVVRYINNFFAGMSDEEYYKRQKEARYYFDRYLSTNAFHAFLFKDEYIKQIEKQIK